jgi:hypothetical protein
MRIEGRTDGRTDRRDKAIIPFSQFSNAPHNATPLRRAIQICSLLWSGPDVSNEHPFQPTHVIEVHIQCGQGMILTILMQSVMSVTKCADIAPIPHIHLWRDVQFTIGATSTTFVSCGICVMKLFKYHGLNI